MQVFQGGDTAILAKYSKMKLHSNLHTHIHALETEVRKCNMDGIWTLAPRVRSTMVTFFLSSHNTTNLSLQCHFQLDPEMSPKPRFRLFARGGKCAPGYDSRCRVSWAKNPMQSSSHCIWGELYDPS